MKKIFLILCLLVARNGLAAITHVALTSPCVANSGGNTAVWSGSTVGANFITVTMAGSLGSSQTVTSANGNTMIPLIAVSESVFGSNNKVRRYYAYNAVVDGSETITVVTSGGLQSICVDAFAGVKSISNPLASQPAGGSPATSTSCQSSAAIIGEDNELILATVGMYSATAIVTINSGFSTPDQIALSPGVNYGVASSYLIQTSGSNVQPTWTMSASNVSSCALAVFKPTTSTTGCVGSSPSLTAPTWDDIQDCHTQATSGDTITVPSGTYTATAPIYITKYVQILMGGTVNVIDSSVSGGSGSISMISIAESTAGRTKLQGPLYVTIGTGTHLGGPGVFEITNTVGGLPVLMTNLHYTSGVASTDMFAVHTNRGVIWNNSMTGSVSESANCFNNSAFVRHKWSSDFTTDYALWGSPPKYGTTDTNGDLNLYVETNTVSFVSNGLDADDNARVVMRYNIMTNSGIGGHGVDTGGWAGPRYMDVDHNTLIFDSTPQAAPCGAPANLGHTMSTRGGTMLIHDNTIPDTSTAAWGSKGQVTFFNEVLNRNTGSYPCWARWSGHGYTVGAGYPSPHQPGWGFSTGATNPGATGEFQDIEPVYIWNNTGSGNHGGTGSSGNPGFESYPNGDPSSCDVNPGGLGPADSIGTYLQFNREVYLNTAKPGYTAYTYPHPLTTGSSPIITYVAPSIGLQGQVLTLTVSGFSTPWVDTKTFAVFGGNPDITVNSTVCSSATVCAVSITISGNAIAGPRNVIMVTLP